MFTLRFCSRCFDVRYFSSNFNKKITTQLNEWSIDSQTNFDCFGMGNPAIAPEPRPFPP